MPPPKTLTFEMFIPLAHRLAKKIAWLEYDQEDLVQEGLFGLHQALEAARTSETEISNPIGFASTVMSRRMQEFYKKRERDQKPHLPLKEDHLISYDSDSDVLGSIYLSEFLDSLEEEYGHQERWVVERLLQLNDFARTPTELIQSSLLAEMPLEDLRRFLLSQYPSVSLSRISEEHNKLTQMGKLKDGKAQHLPLYETSRISHRQVREALGISVQAWFSILASIRAFTSSWFAST